MAGRFVLKLICFGLVSSGIAFGLQEILVFGLNRCNTSARGVWNKVIHGEVNAEILVCGSSRALIHYDPRIISREIGKSAFNTGRTGTFPDLQLSWLKTYLVHNRAPHYILLNVDRNCFCTTKHPYEPEQYIPYLDEPDLYRELVSRERRFARERRIPLLGIIEHRLVLTALGGLVRLNTREDRFDGFEPKDIPWTGEFEKFKALHPTGELASVENALGLVFQGKLDAWRAERAFKRAIELDGKWAAPHYNLALVWSVKPQLFWSILRNTAKPSLSPGTGGISSNKSGKSQQSMESNSGISRMILSALTSRCSTIRNT